MAIKYIKDKITNMASGEILGESSEDKKTKSKQPKKQVKSKRKNINRRRSEVISEPKGKREPKSKRAPKPAKTPKPVKNEGFPEGKGKGISGLFNRRKPKVEDEIVEEEKSNVKVKDESIKPIEGEIEGYEDVLSILGIKKSLDLEVDFKSSDLDYIEFTQTTPLGFDFDEVTDFISRTKYTLDKLESALKQRNIDLVLVASEVKKVEQKMVEQSQAKELEKMIGGMSEEERLIEENMNLRIEINELKGKLIDSEGNGDVDKLNREIEALKAENEMLRMNTFGEPKSSESKTKKNASLPSNVDELPSLDSSNSSKPIDTPSTMPSLDNDSDSIDNMIQDIGGMYDEEE